MQMAQVKGHATATVKHPSLQCAKLLVCSLLDGERRPVGDPVLAVDRHGAGRGDHVVLSSDGQGLREVLSSDKSPVRWWTLGIVDA